MKRVLIRFGLGIITLIVLFSLVVVLFVNLSPAFGDDPSGDTLEKIKSSQYYDGEKFNNLVPTNVDTRDPENSPSLASFMVDFFLPDETKNPTKPLPSQKFDASTFEPGSFVWLGHSTILMNINGTVILTDPVFYNASPVPGTAKPFEVEQKTSISDLPQIDIVLISHDHYDHLDYQAILEIKEKVKQFYVPLGIKSHLTSWGVDAAKIVEKEWYESIDNGEVTFTITPSRHFSGRGITNRYSTLWCSWVVQSDSTSIFFSGDSGYFDEFKKIGDKYGPFDIAFMENGAYNRDWSQIHFMPGENVQAVMDLNAKSMFAIHWGKYDLSRHNWDEPIILADSITSENAIPLITPIIGERFDLKNPPMKKWWKALRN